MPTVDGANTAATNGVVLGNGGATDRMAGGSGNDRLQGMGSQNYYYGGEGNDTFIIGQRYLDTSKAIDPTSTVTYGQAANVISDMGGAGGWQADGNDFIAFSGFAAGSSITQMSSGSSATANAPNAVAFYYDLFDAGTNNHYLLVVNSVNGKALGAGDYAFY